MVRPPQDVLSSTLLGWWGIPWGLIMTPVQLVRGVAALASGDVDRDGEPSERLRDFVRATIAYQAAHADTQEIAPDYDQAA